MSTTEVITERLRRNRTAHGGVAYARRTSYASKQIARRAVLSYFASSRWPWSLSILTLPALGWSFERELIGNREHGKGLIAPRRTHICAIEHDEAIHRAALFRMPGATDGIVELATAPFARASHRTRAIARYHLCELTDLVAWRSAHEDPPFDAAWIDLTGPVTTGMHATLGLLWPMLRHTLVVTSLRARWPADAAAWVREYTLTGWLVQATPGARIVTDAEYFDTSPMHQVILTRTAPELTPRDGLGP